MHLGKGPDLGACSGGLREQVDAIQSLEVVRACDDQMNHDVVINDVWDILSKHQNVLTKESLNSNIVGVIDAWKVCSSYVNVNLPVLSLNDAIRVSLSDATLKAWLGVNLLEDPLGTRVELK
mmetsp:Transcript_20029/g.43409  ORF Transcript_20029/g.43409 Transcript_20029/m.43409 type:complete len:122 (+) Transcript_20029:1844-2209(+)